MTSVPSAIMRILEKMRSSLEPALGGLGLGGESSPMSSMIGQLRETLSLLMLLEAQEYAMTKLESLRAKAEEELAKRYPYLGTHIGGLLFPSLSPEQLDPDKLKKLAELQPDAIIKALPLLNPHPLNIMLALSMLSSPSRELEKLKAELEKMKEESRQREIQEIREEIKALREYVKDPAEMVKTTLDLIEKIRSAAPSLAPASPDYYRYKMAELELHRWHLEKELEMKEKELQREIELRKERLRLEREDRIFKTVLSLLSAVAGALSGRLGTYEQPRQEPQVRQSAHDVRDVVIAQTTCPICREQLYVPFTRDELQAGRKRYVCPYCGRPLIVRASSS